MSSSEKHTPNQDQDSYAPIAHVIYHRADFDGLLSGAVCRERLGHVVMHGWDYGDPVPDIPLDDDLYIVDLSVEGLMDHPNLVWIDHHKSAIDKYDPKIKGFRIDGVAACRLCWQWFYAQYNEPIRGMLPTKREFVERKVQEPLVLTLAGEYDVWDLHDDRAEVLQYGLTAARFNAFCAIPREDHEAEYLVSRGIVIQEYVKAFNASVMRERSYKLEWEGLRFHVLNTARGNSQSFEGADLTDIDALMMWRFDGQKVIVSLYHAPGKTDLDLSVIAVRHGGGGHRGACGFTTTLDALPGFVKESESSYRTSGDSEMITARSKKRKYPVDPDVLDNIFPWLIVAGIFFTIAVWSLQPVRNDLPHLEYRSAR